VLNNREDYKCDPAELKRIYDPDSVSAEYEKLFAKLGAKS